MRDTNRGDTVIETPEDDVGHLIPKGSYAHVCADHDDPDRFYVDIYGPADFEAHVHSESIFHGTTEAVEYLSQWIDGQDIEVVA